MQSPQLLTKRALLPIIVALDDAQRLARVNVLRRLPVPSVEALDDPHRAAKNTGV